MASTGTGGRTGQMGLSFEASGDLSSDQYRAVFLDSNGRVAKGTSPSSDVLIGILQNKPAALGRAAEVAGPCCISKIVVEAAVTVGTWITAGTAGGGSAVPSSGTCHALGIVTKSADTAGDIAEVLLQPFRYTFGV